MILVAYHPARPRFEFPVTIDLGCLFLKDNRKALYLG